MNANLWQIINIFRKSAPKKEKLDKASTAAAEDMVLRRIGKDGVIRYESTSDFAETIQWVSLETDRDGNPVRVRDPEETTTIYRRNDELTVAGKTYPNFQSFLKHQEGQWGEDLYGRKVFCIRKKFPCFDSYDYLHEDRYFRWCFLRNGNSLTRVFSTDERDKIYVSEDLRHVESWAWEQMQDTGFCQPPKA